MTKVLVIQGAGMNMRGKVQLEVFGPTTLEQINEQVKGYAEGLGIDVEIIHSNIEGEVVNALYAAHDGDIDAALIKEGLATAWTRDGQHRDLLVKMERETRRRRTGCLW